MTEEKATVIQTDDHTIVAVIVGVGVLLAIIAGIWSAIRHTTK